MFRKGDLAGAQYLIRFIKKAVLSEDSVIVATIGSQPHMDEDLRGFENLGGLGSGKTMIKAIYQLPIN